MSHSIWGKTLNFGASRSLKPREPFKKDTYPQRNGLVEERGFRYTDEPLFRIYELYT